jgi:hypothetical protein
MTHNNRQVRVVKRGQAPQGQTEQASAAPAQPSEREMKNVVSGWVREHRERAEEFRVAFAGMLREVGFSPARSASRA